MSQFLLCEIWGTHIGVTEDSSLLGCDTCPWWVVSDIFKVCRVSICRVKQTIVQGKVDDPFWMAWPCKWRCFNPSKQQEVLAELPNITSQKTGIYFWLVQFAPRIWYWWIGFKFPGEEQEVFLFCTTAHRPTLGPSQSHSQWVLGALEWW